MAELTREGDELVLTLSTAEKAEAVHGDIRVRAQGEGTAGWDPLAPGT